MNRLKKLNPDIALEVDLRNQIYNALQGNVVQRVLKIAQTNDTENYWRSAMEGNSLKVTPTLLEHYYKMFNGIKDKLGFNEAVDFYITGSSDVNAFSVYSDDEKTPHIVNLNSALVELMTDNEIAFVIGHELGHLINKNSQLKSILRFLFPQGANTPVALVNKVRLWDQLSELEADRYGYLAVENLETCVSAFYKMASGLDIEKMNVKIDVLLDENLKHLQYFIEEEGTSQDSHPVNPIRVQALNVFANAKTDKQLEDGMNDLLSALVKLGSSEIEFHLSYFIASSGLYIASLDGEITDDEIKEILNKLSDFQMFSNDFLNKVYKVDYAEIFVKSVQNILTLDPSYRDSLFHYLVKIVISDKNIDEKEMEFLFKYGKDLFEYSDKEIAIEIATTLQDDFVPNLFDIA